MVSRFFKSRDLDVDPPFLGCVLKSSVFLSGRKIMMNILGPKIHKRTTNPLRFKANEITAVRDLFSVAKYVGMNVNHINPNANVAKETYLDSLKFSGKRIVKIAKALQAMIIIVS